MSVTDNDGEKTHKIHAAQEEMLDMKCEETPEDFAAVVGEESPLVQVKKSKQSSQVKKQKKTKRRSVQKNVKDHHGQMSEPETIPFISQISQKWIKI